LQQYYSKRSPLLPLLQWHQQLQARLPAVMYELSDAGLDSYAASVAATSAAAAAAAAGTAAAAAAAMANASIGANSGRRQRVAALAAAAAAAPGAAAVSSVPLLQPASQQDIAINQARKPL